jgi:hypothetical protein
MCQHNPIGLYRRTVTIFLIGLCLGWTLFITSPRNSHAQERDDASQAVKLYYLRDANKIATILNSIAGQKDPPSELNGLFVTNMGDDEVVLYGPFEKREIARRLIATLDLPRPGITMEMWGIQISSRKPKRLAEVMPRVRNEIDRTQTAVRQTYQQMQIIARDVVPTEDSEFRHVLIETLGYRSALDPRRPLSFPDILLRLIAAERPADATAEFANRLDRWLAGTYPEYTNAVTNDRKRPFERFFITRGLYFDGHNWRENGNEVRSGALIARKALVEFGLHYGHLVHEPRLFSAYFLQQSAELLNGRLQEATDALNADMQDLFVEPTLENIRIIFRDFKDVEYAQVGKTTVASLSGITTAVTSKSVNAFDVTPPLRLSELLDKADKLSKSTGTFVPAGNVVGNVPLAQVIGLVAAFGEERSVWRELTAGVSLNITPNVLRNMTSAELAVDLKTGDPQAGSREQGVRPLSRVSQHDVKTSIYVTALDFFDLSAFASQSTLGGGRGMVPIIGPVWQGLFGPVPVVGKLFSWQKDPQTVFQESLVLTNSFITPTAMGIAVLYPTERDSKYNFESQSEEVRKYTATLALR